VTSERRGGEHARADRSPLLLDRGTWTPRWVEVTIQAAGDATKPVHLDQFRGVDASRCDGPQKPPVIDLEPRPPAHASPGSGGHSVRGIALLTGVRARLSRPRAPGVRPRDGLRPGCYRRRAPKLPPRARARLLSLRAPPLPGDGPRRRARVPARHH